MSALLEVHNLTKSFGDFKAVDDVSFAVNAGEVVALIGPNGAGKSTTFNMLMGQLPPSAGRVVLAGREITGWPARRIWRAGVGRTFQITSTFQSMTVVENVQMALMSHHRKLRRMVPYATALYRDEALDLLTTVGMADQAERHSAVLAYGDLKRLELAIALAHSPKFLLMDEPTAGMAPSARVDLMALTARIADERNVGVLFTEHDMDVVFAHAQRVMVLNRGALIAEGLPEDIRANPLVQEVYLGGGTTFGAEVRDA